MDMHTIGLVSGEFPAYQISQENLLRENSLPEPFKGYSGAALVDLLSKLFKGNGWIVSLIKEGRKVYLGLAYPKMPHVISLLVVVNKAPFPLTFSEVRDELKELERIGEKNKCNQFCLYSLSGYEGKAYKLTRFNLLLYGTDKITKLIKRYSPNKQKEPQIQLFAHNKLAYKSVQERFKTGNKVAVVQATGTGKSYLIAKILQDYPGINKLVLAPSVYILDQLKDHVRWNKEVFFMTYAKTMNLSIPEIRELNPGFIVLDEFHRCGAEEWGRGVQQIIDTFSEVKLFGTSATPVRYMDNARDMAVELFGGNVAENLNLAQAIVRRILPMPKYVCALYTLNEEVKSLKKKIDDSHYSGKKKQVLIDSIDTFKIDWEKTSGIPAVLKKHITSDMRKFIVFCREEDHLVEMEAQVKRWFVEAGIKKKVKTYRVMTAEPESEENFQRFKDESSADSLYLLFSINMLNEGLHVDEVHGVILLRPTASPNIFYQQIGRCLKVGIGHVPVIFDFVNNFRSIRSKEFLNELEYYRGLHAKERKEFDLEDTSPTFNVIDEVREITEVFGEISFQIDTTEIRFQQLREFKATFGHCDVPLKFKENPRLGQWVVAQRMLYRQNKLKAETIERLNALDFSWNPDEKYWLQMFSKLKAFKSETNHCDVKITHKDKLLANWVSSQRSCYKALTLSEDKIRLLEAEGFNWSLKKRMDAELWERSYNELIKFKEAHGHLMVPSKTKSLRNWVADQRKKYTKGVILSKEQIEKLEAIGFQWSFREDWKDAWESKLQELVEYKKKYGRLEVSPKINKPLALWIGNQRNTFSKNRKKITEEQISKLKSIGFSFKVQEEHWDELYLRLCEYQKIYGHCNVPKNWLKDPPLTYWLAGQKRLYRTGKLEPVKRFKLEAIGFTGEQFFQYKVKWSNAYDLLCHYKEEFGDCNRVAHGNRKKFLAGWIVAQRQNYKAKKLTEEQIIKLENIGFEWQYREKYLKSFDSTWHSHFKKAVAFYKEHGHFTVKLTTDANLKSWIQRTREQNREGKLATERINMLNEIGFTWVGELGPKKKRKKAKK
ncbi:MAG: Helicase associated domain protein [Bacteroidetes bacterium]|nr:Helicase associated domain protein [Bacteroidota bacterium]